MGVAGKVKRARIALIKYPTLGATLAVKSRNNPPLLPQYCPYVSSGVVGHDIDINGTVFAVIIVPPRLKRHPAQEHNFSSLNLAPRFFLNY